MLLRAGWCEGGSGRSSQCCRAGLGWETGAQGWGTPALPVPGAQPWLPGPLPPIGAVTSQSVEFKKSRRLEGSPRVGVVELGAPKGMLVSGTVALAL